MSKSSQAREAAKVIVNPLFAWTNAVLKGGEMMLDSMQAAAKNAGTVRVAVLADAAEVRRGRGRAAPRRGRSSRAARRRGRRAA